MFFCMLTCDEQCNTFPIQHINNMIFTKYLRKEDKDLLGYNEI